MGRHSGIITIGNIENEKGYAEFNLTDAHVKFVHYPDCQQFIVWLPKPGREYSKISLINNKNGKTQKKWEVDEVLNGSIQLLWDTLSWKPGEYILEIRSDSGMRHIINLTKHKKPDTVENKIPVKQTENPKTFIQYRDAFGNIIPDEDLILREKLAKDLKKKFGAWLEYTGNFRAGSIIYHDGDTRIEFYHEMGGGNCMFYIEIPSENDWERRTNTA